MGEVPLVVDDEYREVQSIQNALDDRSPGESRETPDVGCRLCVCRL